MSCIKNSESSLFIIIIIILRKITIYENNCNNDTVDITLIIYDKYSKHICKIRTKKNLYIEK